MSVIGAGGHAKVVIATLRSAGFTVARAYDDSKVGESCLGVPVVGGVDEATGPAIIAIGANSARRAISSRLGLEWVSAVHPSAVVHETVRIEPGAVVFAGCVVQPDCILGAHAILNTKAHMDHDGRVGAYAHVCPGVAIAGGVQIGEECLIGTGASIVPLVRIADGVIVGAGAAVVRDLNLSGVYAGVPARRIGPVS